MKKISEFILELNELGIKLWVEQNSIHYKAPKGIITADLLTEIKKHKAEIITFLLEAASDRQASSKPIRRVDREGLLPLSFAQQRLWFLAQLEGNSATYNIPGAVSLTGPLDITALQQAINKLVRRHEVLRTTFPTVNGIAVQQIAQDLSIPLQVIDAADLAMPLPDWLNFEAQQLFDLEAGPLLRVKLVRLGPEEAALALTVHHIVSDAWSMGIFIGEILSLYKAYHQGQVCPLLALPIQYVDYTIWQRQWLQGSVLKNQLSYWKQQLANTPALLDLPTDYPRPAEQTFHGRTYTTTLPLVVGKQVKVLAKQQGVTLFMFLVAAFVILLYRYSGQLDITLGTPIANRQRSELEGLIGFFANTLVLRVQINNQDSVVDLLQKVRRVTLEAYTHQDAPFEQVVEALQPERNLSHSPLFQVMLVLQNAPMPPLKLPGLTLKPLEAETVRSKFDLTLSIAETEAGLTTIWEYNRYLFAPETIYRMTDHFQILLNGMVANPQTQVDMLQLLTAKERQQLLVNWNNTYADYPQDMCIHQLFEQQVDRTPEAVAVVFGEEKLTYQQLNERANQLAHYLQSVGVGPETLVGICLERSVEMIVGLLSILKAGGAYVPLDPAYPKERIAYMLSDSQVSVVLTLSKLFESKKELDILDALVVCLDRDGGAIASLSEENPENQAHTDNLAYIIYTSGSTGKPKGVMVAHKGLCNLAISQIELFDVQPGSRVLQFASLSFDASISEIAMALCAGARLCMGTSQELQPGPDLIALLEKQKITHVTLPPSTLAVMKDENLSGLQNLIVAGEASPVDLVEKWSVGRRLFNAYGPTESTVCATVAECRDSEQQPTIGRPLANTQIYILDSNLQPVPMGVPGELHIGGVGVARGYLNRPELTMAKFIANPFSDEPGARLYKTGDLARYRRDGKIEFVGRIDNQVKIRGFRIELREIEATLRGHIKIRSTVVVAREEQPGDKRLVAYIVPSQTAPDPAELREFLQGQLPDYMVPTAFVMLETIPLTPNGKIDRRALPAPNINALGSEAGFIPPRNTTELQLSQIWSEVLNIPAVGARDNFFDLGGHSLLAVRLMARIKQQFGNHLPLATLFTKGTIEYQASLLSTVSNTQASSCLVPIKPMGSLPPFFCVHPGGGNVLCYADLARQLSVEQPFYGLQAIGINGEEKPLTSIEEMAATYIQAIQTVQPEGPYKLGGWCLGGFVAFEMARQLQASGYEIALLVIIQSFINPLELDEASVVMILAKYLILGKEEAVSVEEIRKLEEEIRRLELDEKLNYVRKKILQIWPLEIELEQMRQLFAVLQAAEQAEHSYVFQAYPGEITFFYAEEPPEELPEKQKQMQNWGSLAAGGINIHKLPGDHYSIIRSEALAKALGLYLKGERNPIDD